MFVKLSHNLSKNDPGWPGFPTYDYTPLTQISKGDVAYTYSITLFNHFGTHFDAPKHYNDEGLRITKLPLDTFIYEKPLLLEIKKSYEEFVTPSDLEPYADQLREADLLMIRSGFVSKRKEDPEGFAKRGPAFSADAAKYVMDNFKLKAIAVDWISLASYAYPDDGTLAHQYLFGKYHDHYTCIIEDACFEEIVGKKIKRVYAFPLMLEDVDSAQVTVIAEAE